MSGNGKSPARHGGAFVEMTRRDAPGLQAQERTALEKLDLLYRSLCALLYNYAPTSGHPGGSVSSGRIVQMLLLDRMAYDIGDPERRDADVLSYAAGHKALGLYALWALRDEALRIAAPDLLPRESSRRLRLEDLLGFRRNPNTATPLFRRFDSRPLDGHPTPATPFVRLATGASGVGMGSSLGLALGAMDLFGANAPRVHILEGEGGLTPGRVAEALAFAGTAALSNAIVHVDWNQASIDSDHVTREGAEPGDYVQWEPAELFRLHGWNVVSVPDGFDFALVREAQRVALDLDNGQPTALVYRTRKGWRYGVQGRASHGAGHGLCSSGFYDALLPLLGEPREVLPVCTPGEERCAGGAERSIVEQCYWKALQAIRHAMEQQPEVTDLVRRGAIDARDRLDAVRRLPRAGAPRLHAVYAAAGTALVPSEIHLEPGRQTTLRAQLGRVLGHLNRASGGALLVGSADLLGSTSAADIAIGFDDGFYHTVHNPGSRTLSIGGIAEDGMAAVLSGLSAFGAHIGVGSSYGAFIAPLGHIAARLHAIGNQARQSVDGEPYRPFFVICGHAGLKTGEDGPTHADPQPLQLLQENFPPGAMITLTPWEPQEIWALTTAALGRRPAVIAPFVTRPAETVLDREALGLAPASAAADGVYRLREARGAPDVAVVLQGSEVAYEFVTTALPLLEREGIDVEAWYVASVELYDALPADARAGILPESVAMSAMGITGFTLPTMYRWIRSDAGRAATLHPFRSGHYPGSGSGESVVREAGLDGASQFRAIVAYATALRSHLAIAY